MAICIRCWSVFADMGVDCLNPIEPPPIGRLTLADAKRRVGERMSLEGGIEVGDFEFVRCGDDCRQSGAGNGDGQTGRALYPLPQLQSFALAANERAD